jgi:PAS domain S-box-containing protein
MRSSGALDAVNPAWQAYTGLDEAAARGDGWLGAIHPEDRALIRERVGEVARTGVSCQVEYRFRRADGAFRWYLAQIATLPGENCTVAGCIGTAIDIYDRRRQEEAMKVSEARARDVIASAGDIVYSLLMDGTVIGVNAAIERVLGYTAEEVLGRSIEVFIIPPDQLEIAREALRQKLAGEERSAYELEVLAKDGHRVTLEIDSRLSKIEGQPAEIHGIARDITSRKQHQVALARLAAIVEDSDEAIVSRLLDGTVTSWNRGAENLYGFSADEMIGTSVVRLVPEERLGEIAQFTDRLARGERVPHVDTVRLRKDGSPVDVSISLSPLTDDAGRLIGVSTIARDITGNKQAEARMRVLAEAGRVLASELDTDARLAAIAHLAVPSLADWCVVDLVEQGSDLRRVAVAHVDPAKLAMAEDIQRRYPPDPAARQGPYEVMRTGRSDMMSEIPDELIVAGAVDAEHLRLLREVGLRSYICVPLVARGRTLGALTFITAESGRLYGPEDLAIAEALAEPAALAIDNAELYHRAQAAETRYRQVFTGVADAILVTDATHRFLEANPAASALLGYSREELLAMRTQDILPSERFWTQEDVDRFQVEGRWQGELELRRKDGGTVPVESMVTAVELPTGTAYLSALRDVTERHRLERLRRDFLAMVTHDLRTPLAAIKGSAQLLHRRGEYRASQIETILGASRNMQRLLDDLADVVRHETGTLVMRPAPMDLVPLVESVASAAQQATESRRVRVVAPPAPLVGTWDRDRLAQVLANLLDNTLKHAPAGGEVVVALEDRGDEVRMAVTDHGPGISPEHVTRLFDQFYRADATGAGGLGLGLYISRMLIEAHGGRIWVESEVGQGSTFTVALPKDGAGD